MKFDVCVRRRAYVVQTATISVEAENAHDAAEMTKSIVELNELELEDEFHDLHRPIYDDLEVIKVVEVDDSDEVIMTE